MEILLQTKVFSPLSSTARPSAVHTVCSAHRLQCTPSAVHTVCSCNCLAQRLRRVNTCLRCARYNTSVRSVLPCAQAHTAPPPSAGSCACSITILMSRHMSHCRETLLPELTSEFCRDDALLEVRTRHPRHRKSHEGSRTNFDANVRRNRRRIRGRIHDRGDTQVEAISASAVGKPEPTLARAVADYEPKRRSRSA
jgi:hypothetical protein